MQEALLVLSYILALHSFTLYPTGMNNGISFLMFFDLCKLKFETLVSGLVVV